MKDFFNRPWAISFKDVLAIAFSSTFLFVCVLACFGKNNALAVLEALIPVIMTILGGYFGHEIATMWISRNQGYTSGYNSYSGYGTQQTTVTPAATENGSASSLSGEI